MTIDQVPPACAAWRVTTRTQTSGALSPICASGEAGLGSVIFTVILSIAVNVTITTVVSTITGRIEILEIFRLVW